MDCFKLQAETLQYLHDQHTSFVSITEQIYNIIKIDVPILQLLGVFVSESANHMLMCLCMMGSEDSDRSNNNNWNGCGNSSGNGNTKGGVHGRVDWVVDDTRSSHNQWSKHNKQKISKMQSINTVSVSSAYDAKSTASFVDQPHFCKTDRNNTIKNKQIIIAKLSKYLCELLNKQSKNRLQKQSQLVDTAYLYFLISSLTDTIPQQYHNFIKLLKEYGQNFTNTTKFLSYVQVCAELQKIGVKLVEDKDLGAVRNSCIELREFMARSERKNKQKCKKQSNDTIKLKNSTKILWIHQSSLQSSSSSLKHIHTSQTSNPNPNTNTYNNNKFKQSIGMFDQHQQQSNTTINNNFNQLQQLLNWKIQSCIILLTQILHKQPYSKQMLIGYLQLGKKLRAIGEMQEHAEGGEAGLTRNQLKLLQFSTNNYNNNSNIRSLVLHNILHTYSNILKYSHKLKHCKYFDIFTMQFNICYKYVLKFVGEQRQQQQQQQQQRQSVCNNHLINNNQIETVLVQTDNIHQNQNQNQTLNKSRINMMNNKMNMNISKIMMKHELQYQQQQHLQKQLPQQQFLLQKLQQQSQQFHQQISFVHLKDRHKKYHNHKNNNNNNNNNNDSNQKWLADYKYIEQQLRQISIQKQKQSFDNYFVTDNTTKVQIKYNKIQQQKKRRIQFHKTLDYLTNRPSPSSSLSPFSLTASTSYSALSKMHINLSGLRNNGNSCHKNGKIGPSMSNFSDDNRSLLARQSKYYPRKGITNSQYSLINSNNGSSTKMVKQANSGNNSNNSNNNNNNSIYNSAFITTRAKKTTKQARNQNNTKQGTTTKQIKVTGRVGTVIRHHSFKNQIIDLISITKRNIKPSKHFSELKDADNILYRAIISTEQRVTVLTIEKLEDEISYIHQVRMEKASPLEEEVLISTAVNDHRQGLGQRDDSYSFKGIGSILCNNNNNNINNGQQQYNYVNTITQKQKQKQKQFTELTMIQCYGHQIGFTKISSHQSDIIQNQNQINFTTYFHGIFNAKLSIMNGVHHSSSSNIGNTHTHHHHHNHNGRNSCIDHEGLLTLKTVFSTEQLRKQISNSQFYFELIQQNLQRNIEGADVDIVCDYILKNTKLEYQCKSLVLNQSRSYSDHQQKLKKAAIQIIVLHRISHSLLYWYYTKASKINGFVLLRREIPNITDSLKFAIALDFLKKYSYKECMEKLCNVRNKIALFQCFRYLLYARKIIVKGFVMRKNGHIFYTVSLENFNQRQFIIKSKEQGQSQFKDVKLMFTMYSRQTGAPFYSAAYYPLESISAHGVTQLLLSNIIEHELPKKPLLALIQDIAQKQSINFSSIPQSDTNRNCQLIQPSAQQKDILIKLHNLCREQCINHELINYVHYLLWFVHILGLPVDFRIVNRYEKAMNVDGRMLMVVEMWLGCGIVLQVFRGIGVKGRNYQDICIYERKDISMIRGKIGHQKVRIMIKNSLTNSQQNKNKNKLSGVANKPINLSRQQKNLYFTRAQHSDNPKSKTIQKSNFYQQSPTTKPTHHEHPSPSLQSQLFPSTTIQPLLQCNPSYFIRRSAYHSRVAIKHPQHKYSISNRRLLNKIKKSIIQKEQMQPLQILFKKVIKNGDGSYVYLCLGYNRGIQAYRVDVYQIENSKRYAAYFRPSQYGIQQNKQPIGRQDTANEYTKLNEKPYTPLLSPYSQSSSYSYSIPPLFPSAHQLTTNYHPNGLRVSCPSYGQFQQPQSQMRNNINLVTIPMNNNYTQQHLPYGVDDQCSSSAKKNEEVKDQFGNDGGNCYFLKINGHDQNNVGTKCYNPQTYDHGKSSMKNKGNQSKQDCIQSQIRQVTNIFKQTNNVKLSNDHKLLQIHWQSQSQSQSKPQLQLQQQLTIPLFRSYNSLSSFSSTTPGKLQLIQRNDRLFLLCQLQHHDNLYMSVVDENPFMENVNIFADFQVKQHLVNLYTDLFMRMFVKFSNNGLALEEVQRLKDIDSF